MAEAEILRLVIEKLSAKQGRTFVESCVEAGLSAEQLAVLGIGYSDVVEVLQRRLALPPLYLSPKPGSTAQSPTSAWRKLDPALYDVIRDRKSKGERVADLAREYGVGKVTIYNIVNRERVMDYLSSDQSDQ